MTKRIPALLTAGLLLAGQGAFAADEELAWTQPFELKLPEPTRTITLVPQADAQRFLDDHGIEGASITPLGQAGSLVEAPMDDDAWQTLSDEVCGLGDVTACDTAVCQGIQLAGTAEPGSQFSAQAVQARLVQNPPEAPELPEELDGDAGTCHGPPLIPELDQPAAAGTGRDLTIDLSVIGTHDNATATPPGVDDAGAPPSPEPEATVEAGVQEVANAEAQAAADDASAPDSGEGATAATEETTGEVAATEDTADADSAGGGAGTLSKQGFQFALKSGFNALGGVNLGTDELPADTSEWTLVVGAGCTEVKVPLSAIEPARLPGIVVALVDAGNVNAVAGAYGLAVVRQLPLVATGQNLVVYATAQNIFTVIAAMAADARVDGAQPEFVYEATAEAGSLSASAAPGHSDPLAALTYGPGMTGALELHPRASGSGQLVAVIDTGIDVEQPDLAGRLRDPVDTTGLGYGAEIHGTAVAGIIAAAADNAIGSYGVAPAAQILPIKACHPKQEGGLSARCTTSSLVKALDVAIMADAPIINMSLAGPPDSLVARLVALAVEQDRLIIAGAGNGGEHGKPGFPAALPGVLAVTAVDVASRPYDQANRGEYIDVAAPGVDIVAAAPGDQYPPLSGTSMAAAHVTGIAALIRELGPTMGARELGLALKSNARDLGDPGVDERFGTGLVDACQAAFATTAGAVACPKGEDDEEVLSF
jgi:subtilisin family serine protease